MVRPALAVAQAQETPRLLFDGLDLELLGALPPPHAANGGEERDGDEPPVRPVGHLRDALLEGASGDAVDGERKLGVQPGLIDRDSLRFAIAHVGGDGAVVWPPKARIVTYNMATEAWIDFATGGQIEFVPEFFKVLENLPLGVWTTQPRKLSVWDRLSNWLLGK